MRDQTLTENEIVSSFKRGNKTAFNTIYEAYWVYLYRIAFKFTRSAEESEDLVQEIFVELWCKRDNVNEASPIKPYLAGALIHKTLNRIRDKQVGYKRDFMTRIRDEYYKNGESNPIEETINLEGLEAWLEDELKHLPFTSQQIFQLSRGEHFTNRQIAEQLNVSAKTVEYHLSKTLSALRLGIRKRTDVIYFILFCLSFS